MGFLDKLFNAGRNGTTPEKESNGNNSAHGAQNAAPAAVPEEPQTMELRFGSPKPVPYNTGVGGSSATLELRYSGVAKVSIADAAKAKNCGGLAALQEKMKEEIISASDVTLNQCSAAKMQFTQLQMQKPSIDRAIKDRLEKEWLDKYGVQLDYFGLVQLSTA